MPKFSSRPVVITDVANEHQEKHGTKKSRRQLKHSNFHVTINTNKQYNAESLQLIEECQKLKNASNTLMSESGLIPFIIFTNSEHQYNTHVKEVEVTGAVERGELHNQVHLHMMIAISHYSNIKLNIPKLKKHFLDQQPELGNVYVSVSVVRSRKGQDPKDVLKNYIFKNRNESSDNQVQQ